MNIPTGIISKTAALANKHDNAKTPIVCFNFNPLGSEVFCLLKLYKKIPDSKARGANMGPNWGRQDTGGPHVCPMSFAPWVLHLHFLAFLDTQCGTSLLEYNVPIILHSQYHDCWCPGYVGIQGISSHGIDVILLKYSGFQTRINLNTIVNYCYGCNAFSHWLRHCSVIDRKQVQVQVVEIHSEVVYWPDDFTQSTHGHTSTNSTMVTWRLLSGTSTLPNMVTQGSLSHPTHHTMATQRSLFDTSTHPIMVTQRSLSYTSTHPIMVTQRSLFDTSTHPTMVTQRSLSYTSTHHTMVTQRSLIHAPTATMATKRSLTHPPIPPWWHKVTIWYIHPSHHGNHT